MPTNDLQTRLTRKGANPEQIAETVWQRPALLSQLFDGLNSSNADTPAAAAKVLRLLSTKHPELLYPHVDLFINLLGSPHGALKWEAIRIIANLAALDSRGRIAQILDDFLEPIRGPVMVTAVTTMEAAATIARAHPAQATAIARAILKVQWADYETSGCRDSAFGNAIESLDRIIHLVDNRDEVVAFVRNLSDNPRNATRKKAAEFLKRH